MENNNIETNKKGIKIYTVVALLAIAVLLIGFFGFQSYLNKQKANDQKEVSYTNDWKENTTGKSAPEKTPVTKVTWMPTETGWIADTKDLPACPSPILKTPVDLTNATSILYPGQLRGGNYKPHGGFRFNNASDNNITVTAPMDAIVVQGSRYLVDGEIQYTFDFINDCGIMYRLGHFLKRDPKYQKIADAFPEAKEGDSRTTIINPPIKVTAGETIATAVGISKGELNVFFDFGVYNLLTTNEATKNAAWAAKPEHDPVLAQHGVCWFNLLPDKDVAKVKSLPAADPGSGKTSDYCK